MWVKDAFLSKLSTIVSSDTTLTKSILSTVKVCFTDLSPVNLLLYEDSVISHR